MCQVVLPFLSVSLRDFYHSASTTMIQQENLKKRLARLAAPIFIETLLIMMLGAVDTVMLSRHSDNSVAAVGVVNQIIMLTFLVFEVINLGTSVLCSQYLGARLHKQVVQVVITYFINMLGVEALATRTYCVNIIMFAYLFSISMAQGGAICIGHLIGEKKPRAAFLMGKYVMKKSVMITVILSCILALFGHVIFGWLTSNAEIIKMGVTILVIDIVLEIGRPVNIFATNALRAAGDVNYPFYVGLVVMWSVAVGLGYLFGIPLGWGICGMWVAFLLDENIRGAIFVRRWYSMKWASKSFIR